MFIDYDNQLYSLRGIVERVATLEARLDQHESDDVVSQAIRDYKTKNDKLRSDNTFKDERIKALESELREVTLELHQFKELHKNIAGLIKTEASS